MTEQQVENYVIVLLGPPGSGKGTQAARLTHELGIPHISTGNLFRENINNNTELGALAKSYINKGNLVPDEVVLDMLFDRISLEDCRDGYLLDGFPRTTPQAISYGESLREDTRLVVINLKVPDEVIIKRISGRLTCKRCGQMYNIYYTPPSVEGKCDRCHGDLYQRDDDGPEVVKERLKVYESQTEPLINYYQKQNVLSTLRGDNRPDTVYSDVLAVLKSVGWLK